MSSQSIKQKLRSKRRSIKRHQNLFFGFVTIFRMGVVKGVMGVINRLLPTLVRSRWLDIGLDLLLRLHGPRARLLLGPHNHANKELGAGIYHV